MSDRHLCRAKRTDNREWVEGYMFDDGMINPEHYFVGSIVIEPYKGTADDDWNIIGHYFYEVDPSTTCQCTGLKDKFDKLIWENDIVTVTGDEEPCLIGWDEDCAKWSMTQCGSIMYDFDSYWSCEVVVIGNIFDNPELLEGGAE